MLECSLYGISRRKLKWKGDKTKKVEQIYSNGIKTAICSRNFGDLTQGEESTIEFRDIPDRNKQRICIVTKISRLKIHQNPELFLDALGFKFVASHILEGYIYFRNEYSIEISRFQRKEQSVDSSEENHMSDVEIPDEFYKNYLVKVFTHDENISEGEIRMEKAINDLCDEVELIKPKLTVF